MQRILQIAIIALFVLSIAAIKLYAAPTELELQIDMALALERLKQTEQPIQPVKLAEPVKAEESLITVYVFKAPFNCPPCNACTRDTEGKTFPGLKFVHNLRPQFEPESYPHLSWQDKQNRWHHVSGWSNYESFKATFDKLNAQSNKITRPVKAGQACVKYPNGYTTTDNHYPKMTGYKHRVEVKGGDFRAHIIQGHGFNPPANLTQDQLEALHDRLHGYNVIPTD